MYMYLFKTFILVVSYSYKQYVWLMTTVQYIIHIKETIKFYIIFENGRFLQINFDQSLKYIFNTCHSTILYWNLVSDNSSSWITDFIDLYKKKGELTINYTYLTSPKNPIQLAVWFLCVSTYEGIWGLLSLWSTAGVMGNLGRLTFNPSFPCDCLIPFNT